MKDRRREQEPPHEWPVERQMLDALLRIEEVLVRIEDGLAPRKDPEISSIIPNQKLKGKAK